jgi:PKD repeat protein
VNKVDFSMEPVPGIPLTYRFFDRSEGNPAAWIWDFADDTTSLEQNPAHTWKNPGTYPVGLRVASKTGSGTVVRKVTVS